MGESGGESPDEGSGSRAYAVVRAFIRFLLDLFYKRLDVDGIENVPARGGLVVAANHHNSIIDAMLLIGLLPRPLRTLAVPTAFLALDWRNRLFQVSKAARAFRSVAREPRLRERLLSKRRSLADELRALSDLVPEERPRRAE